jgi:predicted dehydrogenase
MEEHPHTKSNVNRRTFLASAAAGTGMAIARKSFAQEAPTNSNDLNIAIIGMGAEGRILTEAMVRIPGLRFKAVCDIWDYNRGNGARFLKKYGHDVNAYVNYQDLLAQEKDLDAVVIATPDWMHAEHANACMRAGLDVYCEKEMSNSLEKARSMVETAHETGKLLQIGHQRRSNPRYIHAIDTLIHQEALLGRVTQAYAQWNRAKSEDLSWPKKFPIPQETLEKYGYASMSQFRNWRWYKKYGGGPIVDLGSHQIDIFAWIFGVNPKSVIASGGVDFYQQHEWYDNVMAIYEFENEHGVSRAMYQVLTTTGHGSFYETIMGEDGSIDLSEVPTRGNAALREAHADENRWNILAKRGLLKKTAPVIEQSSTKDVNVDVRESAVLGQWPLPVELFKPAHQPHLENFFDAIRIGTPLNCPGEIGYETAVAVLRVNEAVATNQKINFSEEGFVV